MTKHREQREQRAARRLLAGLRVTPHDEALLAAIRPFVAEACSESELAYRLWRRGLELTLAEAASVGAVLPLGISDELIAGLVAQRLMLCMPLLRRTGMLRLLGIELAAPLASAGQQAAPRRVPAQEEAIDQGAADAIAELGGTTFL
jgi:hypothetical protein